jgi:dihydrofolate synthase / folylpolyglutamate synthase
LTYAEAESYLLSLPRFTDVGSPAYRPGLARMHRLMDGMGRPHEAFESVHVAGTNGKGSTSSMIAAIATAGGRRTGLHTSPHLLDLAERMRLDGMPAPHAWLAEAVGRYRALFNETGPSFFEATVALSFRYFADERVDLAVVEVGMGGRLDATNVLLPRLALVTHVGLDHTEHLGTTTVEIGREKAGIAKPGVPFLTAERDDDVAEAMRQTAEDAGATFARLQDEIEIASLAEHQDRLVMDLATPVRHYRHLEVTLPGRHQALNAALAACATERVLGADEGAVRRGLTEVRKLSGLAGRCQWVTRRPAILADVAHNADGLRAALQFASRVCTPPGRLYVLLGVMRDKDLTAMAALLASACATVLPVDLPAERALPGPELRRQLKAHAIPVRNVASVADGVRWFEREAGEEDLMLITGSHLTVAAVYAAI